MKSSSRSIPTLPDQNAAARLQLGIFQTPILGIFRIPITQARDSNDEQILRILNDSLQGSAEGLGFLLGGTPEFLLDTRRGPHVEHFCDALLVGTAFAAAAEAGSSVLEHSGPTSSMTVPTGKPPCKTSSSATMPVDATGRIIFAAGGRIFFALYHRHIFFGYCLTKN